jgi:hypothetical protein
MRTVALSSLLLALAACGTAPQPESPFAKPNELMGQEIRQRVENIQYQQREELYGSLLWLAQAGEQAVPALLDGLKHKEPKVRSNCSWVLAQIGDRRVIPYLQPLVDDQHDTVSLEAARTLVLLGDLRHVPTLVEGLDSDKVQVRYLCHEALKTSTGRDFDYDHLTDDKLTRAQSVFRWRAWWGEQSNDPFFASAYAQQHGLRTESTARPAAPGGGVTAPSGVEGGTTTPPAGVEGGTPPTGEDG